MFEVLKKRFIIELILIVPDLNKKIKIEVNTSDHITKGVLLIEYEDKKWRLVAYLLKLLNEIEQNYKIHNKEMLVMIRELEV